VVVATERQAPLAEGWSDEGRRGFSDVGERCYAAALHRSKYRWLHAPATNFELDRLTRLPRQFVCISSSCCTP